jgi:hypothetical protein
LRSFHALVKDRQAARARRDQADKDDAAAVERQAEEIKARYTKYFKV